MAQAPADRVISLIQAHPDIQDSQVVLDRLAQPTTRGAEPDAFNQPIERITFVGVGFWYNTGKPVLHTIDFAILRGQSVAVVGATGGGKTTLISLLARFYEPTAGRILINDVDYRAWRLQAL